MMRLRKHAVIWIDATPMTQRRNVCSPNQLTDHCGFKLQHQLMLFLWEGLGIKEERGGGSTDVVVSAHLIGPTMVKAGCVTNTGVDNMEAKMFEISNYVYINQNCQTKLRLFQQLSNQVTSVSTTVKPSYVSFNNCQTKLRLFQQLSNQVTSVSRTKLRLFQQLSNQVTSVSTTVKPSYVCFNNCQTKLRLFQQLSNQVTSVSTTVKPSYVCFNNCQTKLRLFQQLPN
nr:hypothetical protein BgiMline_027641 [Biomphalaria glabrata]